MYNFFVTIILISTFFVLLLNRYKRNFDDILHAVTFACVKHDGQKRKYDGLPYITHPLAVARIVMNVYGNKEMIMASILHDTLEDTQTTYDELKEVFGKKVADMVAELTYTSKLSEGNRAKRKEIDRQHTAKASPEAKTVKLADLIHNSMSIVKEDKKFAKVYLREKEKLLEVLKEGDKELYKIALNQVKEGLKEVGKC